MATGRMNKKKDSSDLDNCIVTVAREKTGIITFCNKQEAKCSHIRHLA